MSERGRPTSYDESYNDAAFKMCLLGATDKELADFFEVSETTINNWKLEHPDFLESIRDGKQKADAEIANSLYQRAKGAEWTEEQAFKIKTGQFSEKIEIVEVKRAAPPDTTAASLWLRNRRPKDWKEKQSVELGNDPENPLPSTDAELARAVVLALNTAAKAKEQS